MIQKDRFKDTVLDDTAEIYKKQEDQTEKQKLSNMSFKQKLIYFNDYYRNKLFILIISIALVIYFAYTIFSPKAETILYASFLNNTLDTDTATIIQQEFSEYLTVDQKSQEVFIDNTIIVAGNGPMTEYTIGSEQKFAAMLAAKELDIIVAPESVFSNYADKGFMVKLSEQLTTEMCSNLADSFYYTKPEAETAKGPYGIYLKDSSHYKGNIKPEDPPVLGIVVNSQYKENAVEFINYIFNIKY